MALAEAFPAVEYEWRRAEALALLAELQVSAVIVAAPGGRVLPQRPAQHGAFVFTALVLDTRSQTATLVARKMEAATAAQQSDGCAFAGYRDG